MASSNGSYHARLMTKVTNSPSSCKSQPLCHLHAMAMTNCHTQQSHPPPQVAAALRPSWGLTGRALRQGSSTAIQTWRPPSESSARRVPRKVCQQSLGSVLRCVNNPAAPLSKFPQPRLGQAQIDTVCYHHAGCCSCPSWPFLQKDTTNPRVLPSGTSM